MFRSSRGQWLIRRTLSPACAFWSGPEDVLAGKIEHATEDNEGD
jgi:hypothetical protein